MNRRELLKMLGVLSVAGTLEGCGRGEQSHPVAPSQNAKIHTLQILLEGAFAIVLQKQSQRLTAFVPLAEPSKKDLDHYFCFNDPEAPMLLKERSKSFHFALSGEGLHKYQREESEKETMLYVNPGFNDFSAEVNRWTLPPSLVILDLPVPRSINFSGRPLNVVFAKGALKPTGMMPTNFILEYRVDDETKVNLKCDQPDVHCGPSPHCPPGVLRYFFGVGPTTHDPKIRQLHAVDFFNFILDTAFPELREKYRIASIEQSDYEQPELNERIRPVSFRQNMKSSAFSHSNDHSAAAPRGRMLPVASLVDCQLGGLFVRAKNGAGQ